MFCFGKVIPYKLHAQEQKSRIEILNPDTAFLQFRST